MISIKSTLSQKDKKIIETVLYDLVDLYSDFYLTKDNLRLAIKENMYLLYNLLSKGDKIIFDEKGIAVIIGFAEKSPRKYLKILAKDNKTFDRLIKNVDWNLPYDIYAKVKKNNPLKEILLKNKFKFRGNRGQEILLYKEKSIYPKFQNNNKE